MKDVKQKSNRAIEIIATKTINWVGSTGSIVVHTLIFIISFMLYFMGIRIDKILLVLTTVVSLEAIYLSIFIQMSVNKQSEQLSDVAEDIDEIQEDEEEEEIEEKKHTEMMLRIENTMGKLIEEVIDLKKATSKNQEERNK
jgi:hypothetical protein